jgi:hypothetical protein
MASLTFTKAFSAILLGTLLPASAWACSVCDCGDPLVAAGNARPVAGQANVALELEALAVRAQSDVDARVTESLSQQTLRAVIAFSPTDWLNAVVSVPLVRKDFLAQATGLHARSILRGLGDVDVGMRAFLWNSTSLVSQRRQNLAVSLGMTLPTGDYNALGPDGYRLDDHAQLGTGSLIPYAGLMYAFHQDPWNFYTSLTGRKPLRNPFDYQYGAAAQWSLRMDYRFVDRIALGFGVDGRYAARDSHTAMVNANTGGLVLAAVPTLKINLWDELWLQANVQIPFVQALYGVQWVGPTATMGFQYLFPGGM